MKLESGDAFEQRNAHWLRDNLPFYETIWAAFIGHKGNGWPCDMPGLTDDQELDRKKFYQAHYSFARMMPKIAHFSEEIDGSLGAVGDFDASEQAQDRLFCFMSQLGHVRDMFKLMEAALRPTGSLSSPLQDFYAQRSHVIHGPRLPARIVDGMLMIPKIGGENKLFTEWDDKATWDSVGANNFVFLRDFVADVAENFRKLVVVQHGKVFDGADKRFDGRRIVEPEMSISTLPPTPGSVFSPAISAYQAFDSPPSGQFRD